MQEGVFVSILVVMKKNFLLLLCFFVFGLSFAAEPATAVFTGEDYSIYVTYSESLQPGDPLCVRLDFTPSKKTMREPDGLTQAILLFGEKKKTDFFVLDGRNDANDELSLCAMIPLSTYQETSSYDVTIMYSAYGREYMKFSLPISVKPKEFISETLELDNRNTAIKTDTSSTRMNQIDRLNEILFTVNSNAVYQKKPFVAPTTATRRTSFFGDRRVYTYVGGGSSTSLHYGIDYGIPTGSVVTACGDGRVVMAEERVSSGLSVVIEHMPGLYSLYYHLDSFEVKVGDMVKAGDKVGLSGSTGLATGPHLHWEVRLNGEAVNPDFFTEKSFSYFQ